MTALWHDTYGPEIDGPTPAQNDRAEWLAARDAAGPADHPSDPHLPCCPPDGSEL